MRLDCPELGTRSLVPAHLPRVFFFSFRYLIYQKTLTHKTKQKFIARKARKFTAQHNRLALPALEFGYFFLAIARAPRAVVRERMLPRVEALLSALAVHKDYPAGYGTRPGGKEKGKAAEGEYWDDFCLAKFLEGVCVRYLVYEVR